MLDVRPAAAYAAGHVHGAINVPVSGSSFGTRAAFLISPDERIVLHGSPEEVELAARRYAPSAPSSSAATSSTRRRPSR